jgi:DNA-binding cell septation regulator SpoVG
MKVEVTKIFKRADAGSKLKGFATVSIQFEEGHVVSIDGVKILDGSRGLFCGLPSTQSKKDPNQWFEIIDLSQALRDAVRDAVIVAYEDPEFRNKPVVKKDNKGSGKPPYQKRETAAAANNSRPQASSDEMGEEEPPF